MLQTTLQSLPRTLDDTYLRILLGIDQEYVRDAISVLQWLAFSARPVGWTKQVASRDMLC